jgi:hypothetical protein
VLLAGCGSSSKSGFPTIQPAKTYSLGAFAPSKPVRSGEPTRVSFVIRTPSGKPLTSFRRGPGPHTGVHLIIVRRDLSSIVHLHPPIAPDGTIADTITFDEPGPYRVVVDAYPNTTGPQRNFQLLGSLRVAGTYVPKPLPAATTSDVVDGFRVSLVGHPKLHAIQAGFVKVTVRDAAGHPGRLTPWFGALAHAIFFRAGSLDYFHTHVCAAGASGCTSAIGTAKVTGTSSTPGTLNVGVLVPVAGTWRLFLQCRVNGRVLTAPFTLHVEP